jgi:hypothetical protein
MKAQMCGLSVLEDLVAVVGDVDGKLPTEI